MGREIRRVPLDFNWPLGMLWKGYHCPYRSQRCDVCEGTGESEPYRAIRQAFDCGKEPITQEEVDILLQEGWVFPSDLPVEDRDHPTPAEVAYATQHFGDWKVLRASNKWKILSNRAETAGIVVDCLFCGGEGLIWHSEEIMVAAEGWTRENPPKGEGWQVWETVSGGSPVTPVFATADELVDYLVKYGDLWCQKRPHENPPSRKSAEAFVKGGWVPGTRVVDGNVVHGIDIAGMLEDE